MTKQDSLNTPMVALIGFLGTVIVFVIVVLLVVVYRGIETQQRYLKDVSQPYGEISDLVTRQRDALASYGWVDQEKGIVSVPVSRAIDLVVGEIRSTGQAIVTRPGDSAEEPAEEPETAAEGPSDEPAEPAEGSSDNAAEEPQETDDAQPE